MGKAYAYPGLWWGLENEESVKTRVRDGRGWGDDAKSEFTLLIWTLRVNLPGGSSLTRSPE